jgi:hypothetical protein
MSSETTTTWTCDRCGETDAVAAMGQPQYWGRLRLTRPPKAAELDTNPLHLKELCSNCVGLLGEWLQRRVPQEGGDYPVRPVRPQPENDTGVWEKER